MWYAYFTHDVYHVILCPILFNFIDSLSGETFKTIVDIILRLSTISLCYGTLERQDANVWCSTIYYTVYFEVLT